MIIFACAVIRLSFVATSRRRRTIACAFTGDSVFSVKADKNEKDEKWTKTIFFVRQH
jgi:hypothetical protein